MAVFTLTACGGGSDNSTPTDSNKIFSLEQMQFKTIGAIYSTSLAGSDFNGTN